VEMAKKCYLIAADQKFLQGRKTKLIVGIILYSLCRQNKTMHLLIDFSDVLETNLYVLGNLYLKLIKLLHLKIPQIDPSLFIQRFCNKLKLGDQSNQISNTALKILQSMKRNWLHLGRRPNGLCGAAILIAASCHQKKRSLEEIVDVVHVCNGTIKKRINEFSLTPASNVTKEELDNIPIIDSDTFEKMMEDDRGMDPPSYIYNRLKDMKIFESDVLSKTLEIERRLYIKVNQMNLNSESKVKIVFQSTNDKIDPRRYVLEPYPNYVYLKRKKKNSKNEKRINKEKFTEKSSSYNSNAETLASSQQRRSQRINSRKNSLSLNSDKNSENTKKSNITNKTKTSNNNEYDSEEELSQLDEYEAEIYLLNPEEQRLKKNLWEVMYQDWIEEQDLKKKENLKKNNINNEKNNNQKDKVGVSNKFVRNSGINEALFMNKKRRINNEISNLLRDSGINNISDIIDKDFYGDEKNNNSKNIIDKKDSKKLSINYSSSHSQNKKNLNENNLNFKKIKVEHNDPVEAIKASKKFPKNTSENSLKKLFS